MMGVWATAFDSKNVHLIKDVGMIPFEMYKSGKYDSWLVTYKNGEYPYAEKDVKGLKLKFIKRITGKYDIDILLWLIKNARSIDVLHVFHLRRWVWLRILLYKFLHPNGQVYLKLDSSIPKADALIGKRYWRIIIKSLKHNCNVISAERKEVIENIEKKFGLKLSYIPNGYYDDGSLCNYIGKRNEICTCGRNGTYQKNTEMLLNGYAKAIHILKNTGGVYKLNIIGSVSEEIRPFIKQWKEKNPEAAKTVVFTGEIVSREKLNSYYDRCKIFCLTSRYESFGIVLPEAASRGCYILSTDVGVARELTDICGAGSIVPVNDVDAFADELVAVCAKLENENDSKIYEKIALNTKEAFNWTDSCEKLARLLD